MASLLKVYSGCKESERSFDIIDKINLYNFEKYINEWADNHDVGEYNKGGVVKVEKFSHFGYEEAYINTTVSICPRIHIFKEIAVYQGADFPLKYSNWKEYLANSNSHDLKKWFMFRSFVINMCARFNHDLVIYIDDSTLQEDEARLETGAELGEFLKATECKISYFPISYLREFSYDYELQNSFFYDDLDSFHENYGV